MAQDNATMLNTVSVTSSTSQTMAVTDVISEGPIFGLVDGSASVFLDNTRLVDLDDTQFNSEISGTEISFNGSSKIGTTTLTGGPVGPVETEDPKYLILRRVDTVSSATATLSTNTPLSYGIVGIKLVGTGISSLRTDGNPAKSVRILNTNGTQIQGIEISGSLYSNDVFYAKGLNLGSIDIPSTVMVVLDRAYLIDNIQWFASTIELQAAESTPPAGAYKYTITKQLAPVVPGNFVGNSAVTKYEDTNLQFRTGQVFQPPLNEVGGVGNVSKVVNKSIPLHQVPVTPYPTDDYSSGSAGADGVEVTLEATADFGLSGAKIAEVDELRIIIEYNSLISVSDKSGKDHSQTALYEMSIDIVNDGETTNYPLYGSDRMPFRHTKTTKSPISFEHAILLEEFGPRDGFTVRISRLTRHEGRAVREDGSNSKESWKQNSQATITYVSSIIKEKFSYPYTAYAGVTFSSRDFSSMPVRTYHCRGLKVQIPVNYTTRENAADGVADYDNVWNGLFKTEKEYTDNPAWIFYDIILNDRYGVGEWLSASEINKYSLYRIARYCDELVDDGTNTGNTEPRFRANIYLTKAVDTYKVIKDMATIFLGMLYWMDGEISPVIDQPKDATFNFSKANVIDGTFSYETTGARTRINQVVVSWNNPQNNYELEPLLVEDKDSILKTGRIINQSAVAFGCTSEGQALRYGRWKLWTAQNQVEVVSFQTALNAGYVRAGDVINIQDSDRYGNYLSGRVIAVADSTTLSTSNIPLDRYLNIETGYTYDISVVITQSSAVLAQDSATVNAVSYVKGDIVDTNITEADASNILDSSTGELVAISYSESSYSETRPINVSTTGDTPVATVTTPFSTIPAVGSIYVIAQRDVAVTGLVVAGSSKQYRVLSIAESAENIYDIAAVEYYLEKYDAVEKDYTLGEIDDLLFPPKDAGDSVPAPEAVYILTDSNFKKPGEELHVQWDAPEGYRFTAGFEIYHDIEDIDSPIRVGKKVKSYAFNKVRDGVHNFGVRTIATDGDKSRYKMITVDIEDPFSENLPRLAAGVVKGLYSTSNAYMVNDPGNIDNVITFETPSYAVRPLQEDGFTYSSDILVPGSYNIDVNAIPEGINLNPTPFEKLLESYFILFDASGANPTDDDPYKIVQWDWFSLHDLFFWKEFGATTWTSIGGTVSISERSNIVTGSGTTFTNLKVGDVLRLSGLQTYPLKARGAKVVAILSDTELVIDRSFNTATTNYAAQTPVLNIDLEQDAILGRVHKPNGSVIVDFFSYITIDNTLLKTFYQDEAPLPPAKYNLRDGDLWVDTDGNNSMYRWNGTDWINVMPKGMSSGYYKNTAPVNDSPYTLYEDDIWFDITTNSYVQHRWTDGAWTTPPYDPWVAILFNSGDALATADGIVHLILQDEEPVEIEDIVNYDQGDRLGVGDLWVDTNFGNSSHIWDGVKWIPSGVNATSYAVYVQDSEPTDGIYKKGDTWYESDNNFEQRVYMDGTWKRVTSEAPSTNTDPILLVFSGQSNCTGWGTIQPGWVANNKVFDWTTGGGGAHSWEVADLATPKADFNVSTPEVYTGFRGGADNAGWRAANFLQALTGRDVYVVTTHKGGASIAGWDASGEMWVELDAQVAAARAAIPNYAGLTVTHFLWFQGETDEVFFDSDQYITRFDALYDRMIAAGWNFPGFMSINIFELSSASRTTSFHNATFSLLNHGRPGYTRVVNNSFLAASDDVHFDGASLKSMGEDCGLILNTGINAKTPFPRGMPMSIGNSPAAWNTAAFSGTNTVVSIAGDDKRTSLMRFTQLSTLDVVNASWTLGIDPEAGDQGALVITRPTGETEGPEDQLYYAKLDIPGIRLKNAVVAQSGQSWEISLGELLATNTLAIGPVGGGPASVFLNIHNGTTTKPYNFYEHLSLPYSDFSALGTPDDPANDSYAAPKGYVDTKVAEGDFVDLTTAQTAGGLKTWSDTAIFKDGWQADNVTVSGATYSGGVATIGDDNVLLVAPSNHESSIIFQTKSAVGGTLYPFTMNKLGVLQLPLLVGGTANAAVRSDRLLTTGDGLTGGGDLTSNRTLSVDIDLTTNYLFINGSGELDVNTLGIVTTNTTQTISATKTFSVLQTFARVTSSYIPTADNDLCNKLYVDNQIVGTFVDLTTAQTAAGIKTWSAKSVFDSGLEITNGTIGAANYSIGVDTIGDDNVMLFAPSNHESTILFQTKSAVGGTTHTFTLNKSGGLQLPVLTSGSTVAAVRSDRNIATSGGIQGGGNLTANRTFSLATIIPDAHTFSGVITCARITSNYVPTAGIDLCNKDYVDDQSGSTYTGGDGINVVGSVISADIDLVTNYLKINGSGELDANPLGLVTTNTTQTVSASKTWSGGNTFSATMITAKMRPSANITYDLGGTSNYYRVLYCQTGLFSGNITAYYSDERLKDIHDWLTPEHCLDSVMKWRPVRYTAKDWTPFDSDNVEVGLLAQDIERTTPEAVAPAPFDNEYKTLHYERLIPELVGAIQELKREIEELKNGTS